MFHTFTEIQTQADAWQDALKTLKISAGQAVGFAHSRAFASILVVAEGIVPFDLERFGCIFYLGSTPRSGLAGETIQEMKERSQTSLKPTA
jgi:hypothetical protein